MKVNYGKWICKSCSKPCFAETADDIYDYGRPSCCLKGYDIHKWIWTEEPLTVKDI